MAINKRLLRRVRDHILAEPHKLNMGLWGDKTICGTTACIAGWVCLLAPKEKASAAGFSIKHMETAEDAAPILLRSSRKRTSRLFYWGRWPDQFKHRYNCALNNGARADAAAACIDHFIATNGAE